MPLKENINLEICIKNTYILFFINPVAVFNMPVDGVEFQTTHELTPIGQSISAL